MKGNFKLKLLVLCLLAAMIISGCAAEVTPYETNNADNYTVSVRYDANGGIFTTNTYSIVDSYNMAESGTEIALLSPDNSARGNDAFTAINNGYFLAGWYKTRNEAVDASGNKTITYSDKWDFDSDLLKLDENKTYSSENPVMTLYAAWVPLFKVEFYSLSDGGLISEFLFDPNEIKEIPVPQWSEETGMLEMHNFPEKSGYTFDKVFYDREGSVPVETEFLEHKGTVDYETGTAENSVLKLYVDWKEGEWYRIYNAEQLSDNANLNGNYEILADLDFADEIWPTLFMYGNFGGKIIGNGHTIKNVSAVQTNNSKVNAGMFGYLAENAEISDLTFENASFTIQSGTRVTGTNYGLFAGSISKDALVEKVGIKNSKLLIDSKCYFGADDYTIGLVCGMGNSDGVDPAEIQCSATGENPERLNITIDGNEVTVVINE